MSIHKIHLINATLAFLSLAHTRSISHRRCHHHSGQTVVLTSLFLSPYLPLLTSPFPSSAVCESVTSRSSVHFRRHSCPDLLPCVSHVHVPRSSVGEFYQWCGPATSACRQGRGRCRASSRNRILSRGSEVAPGCEIYEGVSGGRVCLEEEQRWLCALPWRRLWMVCLVGV